MVIRWFIVVALLLSPSLASAWTADYSWTAVPNATEYVLERSTDGGTTWVEVARPAAPAFAYTGAETGLTLFRVSACNANGCTPRWADGLWHNEAWAPPAQPTNLGVQ